MVSFNIQKISMDISHLLTHTSSPVVPSNGGITGLGYDFIPVNALPLFDPISTIASALPQPSSQPLTVTSLPDAGSPFPAISSTLPLPSPGQPARPSTVVIPSISSLAIAPIITNRAFVDTGGATCFAERNPLKDVQPPRFRVRKSKSDAVKLGQAERIAAKSQKAVELKNGIDAIINSRDRQIKNLSEELDVTEQKIQKLINGNTHYKKHRKPNMFNALVHKVTDEINTGNISSAVYFEKAADEHFF
jgi:hypothetical protein